MPFPPSDFAHETNSHEVSVEPVSYSELAGTLAAKVGHHGGQVTVNLENGTSFRLGAGVAKLFAAIPVAGMPLEEICARTLPSIADAQTKKEWVINALVPFGLLKKSSDGTFAPSQEALKATYQLARYTVSAYEPLPT